MGPQDLEPEWTCVHMPHPFLIHLKLGVFVTPTKGPVLQVPRPRGKLLPSLAFQNCHEPQPWAQALALMLPVER